MSEASMTGTDDVGSAPVALDPTYVGRVATAGMPTFAAHTIGRFKPCSRAQSMAMS